MTKHEIKALIVCGFGFNCEAETAAGFELCGAIPVKRHLNDLLRDPAELRRFHILAFIGGFSFGDHLGAATVIANRLKYRLGTEIREFVSDGRLVIGICNGFQTLARLGLTPALDGVTLTPQVALTANDKGCFRDAWITLGVDRESPCIFTAGIDRIELPIRHGEGKLVAMDQTVIDRIEADHLAPLRYVSPDTNAPTQAYPHNPNGSTNAIAGVCDQSGRVFGLMPHPEAYLSPQNHPQWLRQKIAGTLPTVGAGRRIFQNAVDFARKEVTV